MQLLVPDFMVLGRIIISQTHRDQVIQCRSFPKLHAIVLATRLAQLVRAQC